MKAIGFCAHVWSLQITELIMQCILLKMIDLQCHETVLSQKDETWVNLRTTHTPLPTEPPHLQLLMTQHQNTL